MKLHELVTIRKSYTRKGFQANKFYPNFSNELREIEIKIIALAKKAGYRFDRNLHPSSYVGSLISKSRFVFLPTQQA